jgi:hypothetical protein
MTESINKTTSTNDVAILELKLVSSNGQTSDLLLSFNAINIFEDIFQSVVTGTIEIKDGVNLLTKHAIHGNEYLYITFGRPGEVDIKDRYTKVFRIYKISDRKKSKNGQIQTYILHFCSEELIYSNQLSISRSYSGGLGGGTATEYIANICLFDLKMPFNKLVDFETSYGPTQFTLTRKKPFEAIEYFAQHSFSSSLSPFVFFENKRGFNFVSLQYLFKRDPIAKIKYSTAKFTEDANISPFVNSTNVNDFKINKSFDVLKSTKDGSYSSKLFTLDLISQKYSEYNMSLLNTINSDVMIDGYFPFNNATNRNDKALYQEHDSKINYWLTNKGRSDDYFVEDILIQRKMHIDMINNTELHCVVPGNPQYSAGYTVEFDLPAFTPNQQTEKVLDPYYSGKYLITAVRHVIVPGSLQTVLELCKNSVSEPLDLARGTEYKKAQKL